MFDIEFTQEAIEDLRFLRKFEQQQVVDAVEKNLRHEPTKKLAIESG